VITNAAAMTNLSLDNKRAQALEGLPVW
jgi:hypothetical protein